MNLLSTVILGEVLTTYYCVCLSVYVQIHELRHISEDISGVPLWGFKELNSGLQVHSATTFSRHLASTRPVFVQFEN